MVHVVTKTEDLSKICAQLRGDAYVSVDTEFMRESTYWPKLCLIQMANAEGAAVIDALAPGLDLQPFFELMADTDVEKVFHAARQDIEIVWHMGGLIPAPIFDTQVAAMVCGYGDSVSYEQLVFKITGERIDKSSRFTDWSRRPLADKQLAYALSDVTHLREVFHSLKANLAEQGRTEWVQEEMAILKSPDTYCLAPQDAWKRLKMRVRKPREIAVMMAVADWREAEAQNRNVPRNRVLKDDAIYEIAQQQPKTPNDLGRLRSLPKGFERSKSAHGVLGAVSTGLKRDPDTVPKFKHQTGPQNGAAAVIDLLKVLLKAVADNEGVAPRVIATVDDLTAIATDDDADVAALKGWRRELFGQIALRLKAGEISLAVSAGRVRVQELTVEEPKSLAAE
ncbi:MAG: ribonuclease D [Hyphomicrobiales bacterium]|nr:ribonuclease D [Hyphomicrobiales bacterium]